MKKAAVISAAPRMAFGACAALLVVAVLAVAGCGAQPAGESGSTAEEDGVPAADLVMSPTPSISFEAADDGMVVVHMATTIQNAGDTPRAITYGGAFAVQGADGSAIRVQNVRGHVTLEAGDVYAVNADARVARDQLDTIAGVRVGLATIGDTGLRVLVQDDMAPVDEPRQTFLDEEAKLAEEQRIAAWRERYPLDDYSDTVLIGDSIMQNATSSLLSELPGVTVNADAGRTLEKGGLVFENESPNLGVLDHVRNDGGWYDRYVIGTGNNDPGGLTVANAEEIIACLSEDKQIYFVTMATRGYSNSREVTNATIADVVARYDNVHAIDWWGVVEGNEYDYLADYCHPYRYREPDYARCIREGLEVPYTL